MISYRKYRLANGLSVLTHEAWDTPLATVNLLYNVGSRNEDPSRTGFAHLFEHLMFGGTPQVPDFDTVVSAHGGESNAFTNCDYTNYYITLPVDSLSTALLLEADRMAHLDISQRALEVQQNVVTEEYNQRYMNQPYGDTWLQLRPLCYKVHPYRWPTIGADIRHVSQATLDDVRAFHQQYYRPENAILAIAAPMTCNEMISQVEKAWDSAATPDNEEHNMAALHRIEEPRQESPRHCKVFRDIPSSMVFLAYPMCDRFHPQFRACDLLTDLLASGKSSRLHQHLVKEQRLFIEADACISGDAGPGLLVLSGKLQEGVDPDRGIQALREEALHLAEQRVDDYELEKVLNRYENTFVFSQYKAADRAMGLCYYAWMGDTNLVNNEPALYRHVTPDTLQEAARETFNPLHENTLYYLKK